MRSLTSAPFCKLGRSYPTNGAEYDLPPAEVEELERERFVSVRRIGAPPAEPKAPPRQEQQQDRWHAHGRRR